jgi:hypothetical protein
MAITVLPKWVYIQVLAYIIKFEAEYREEVLFVWKCFIVVEVIISK